MISSKRTIVKDGFDIDNRYVIDRIDKFREIIFWIKNLSNSSGKILFVTGNSGSGKTMLIEGSKKIILGHSSYLQNNHMEDLIIDLNAIPFEILRCDSGTSIKFNVLKLFKTKRILNSIGASLFGFGGNLGWERGNQQSFDILWTQLKKENNDNPFIIALDVNNLESMQYWDSDLKFIIEDGQSHGLYINVLVSVNRIPSSDESFIKNADEINMCILSQEYINSYIDSIAEINNVSISNKDNLIFDYLRTGDFRSLNKAINQNYIDR